MSFVDRTREAGRELREKLGPVAADMAEHTSGEIVRVMEEADPSGEEYADPEGGLYEASAPGEPPAIRTGAYVASYGHTEAKITRRRAVAAVTSDRMVGPAGDTPLWAILRYGTFAVAPRPHIGPGARRAARAIREATGAG